MRWLLTYADLITLLMVFFIVMYSLSQLDQAKYAALAQALRTTLLTGTVGNSAIEMNTFPGEPGIELLEEGLGDNAVETESLEKVGMVLARWVAAAGLEGQVNVTMQPRGLVVSFTDAIFFDLGSAVLHPESKRLLDELAPILASLPNDIAVEGHTDDLPIQNAQYPTNWELSTRRATNVVRYLTEEAGMDPTRFSATGYGEWHPRYPNDSIENRQRNRRVDIVLLREAAAENPESQQIFLGPPSSPAGNLSPGKK